MLPSQATYFVTVDISGFAISDTDFAQRLVWEFGIATIQVSTFYAENPNVNNVWLCLAKKRETLERGLERLRTAAFKMGIR